MSYRWRVILYVLVALVGYALPWIAGNGTALSMGAYDLSEWTSLHPLNRNAALPLITSALLRMPLALTGIYLAAHASCVRAFTWGWWLLTMAVVGFILASLPPMEWLTEAPRDLNYLQQAVIAAGLAFSGSLMLSGLVGKRIAMMIQIIVLSVAMLAAWFGLYQTITLFQQLELTVVTGPGIVLFSVVAAIAILDSFSHIKRVNRFGLPRLSG